MREIEFRGKCIRNKNMKYRSSYKNGDWVYGLVTEIDNYYKRSVMTNFDGISGIDVQTETLGQYTGLKDKNGTKIFEGDILRLPAYLFDGETCVCVYHDTSCGVGFELIESRKYNLGDDYCILSDEWDDFEVIGNIHDNPKLLEATDD